MAAVKPLFAVCVCLLSVGVTLANPWFFMNDNKLDNCGKHPERAYGLHLEPQQDSAISFSLVDTATNTAVAATDSLSRGASYTVTVSWAGDERALLTTSVGSWSFIPVGGCALSTYTLDKGSSVTSTLQLPCDVTSGTVVELKATHTRIAQPFAQAAVSFTVGDSLAASCPAPPSPPSPGAPPTPEPSPVASPTKAPKKCKRRRSRSLKAAKPKVEM